MGFLVPLQCVVSCKQLICGCFSCLPFNRRKCWWKNKYQDSQTIVIENMRYTSSEINEVFSMPCYLVFLSLIRGQKCQHKCRRISEMVHFKEAKYCQSANHLHLASFCFIQNKILMVNLLKYLILLQYSSFCVPLRPKLKEPEGYCQLQIMVKIPQHELKVLLHIIQICTTCYINIPLLDHISFTYTRNIHKGLKGVQKGSAIRWFIYKITTVTVFRKEKQ